MLQYFHIRVNTGDKDTTKMYWFVHKDHDTMSVEEQAEQWDAAVKELNHIYKDYGRFATSAAVYSFFKYHGFEFTVP